MREGIGYIKACNAPTGKEHCRLKEEVVSRNKVNKETHTQDLSLIVQQII